MPALYTVLVAHVVVVLRGGREFPCILLISGHILSLDVAEVIVGVGAMGCCMVLCIGISVNAGAMDVCTLLCVISGPNSIE